MHAKSPARRRAVLVVVTAGAVAALSAPSSFAQSANANTVPLSKAGSTSLKFTSTTAALLKRLGVKVSAVGPAKASGGTLSFPITSGSIDPKTMSPALINHSGGLQFSKGSKKVKLTNPVIRVGQGATLSAASGGARLTVADLDASKAKISRPRSGGPAKIGTKASNIGVSLSSAAAKALNAAFGVRVFRGALTLGTATVDARPSKLILESGTTAVKVDPITVQNLTSAGVTPAAVAPATAGPAATFTFPITRSQIATSLTTGTISHSGGISLTKGSTALSLTAFDIRLGATPTLAASVNGGSPKAEILDLDLGSAAGKAKGKTGIVVAGVKALISQTASDALTNSFGLPTTAGATFGTAVITAQAR